MQRTDTSKSAELLAKAKKDFRLFKEYKSEKAASELLSATKQFMENYIEVIGLQSFGMLSTQVMNKSGVDLSRLKKFDELLSSSNKNIILSKDEVTAVLDSVEIKNGKLKQEFRDIMDVCRKAFDETKMGIGQKYLTSSYFSRGSASEARAALQKKKEDDRLARIQEKAAKPRKEDDVGPATTNNGKEPKKLHSSGVLTYEEKLKNYIERSEKSLAHSLESLEKFVALVVKENGIDKKALPNKIPNSHEILSVSNYGRKRAAFNFSDDKLDNLKEALKLNDDQLSALSNIIENFRNHYAKAEGRGFQR